MPENNTKLSVIVLAAGKGTRMKSCKAKVLHEVFYAPMIHHVLLAAKPLSADETVVVVGHQREEVEQSLNDFPVNFALQAEQLGTGHAVLCAEESIEHKDGVIMILCGDTPLVKPETLENMFAYHCSANSTVTVMTTFLENPTHYGRMVTDTTGKVTAIVEEKDATDEQRKIKQINAGIYCIDGAFLFEQIKKIGSENSQGEVYLTDIISLAVEQNKPVHTFVNNTSQDILGVNSRVELSEAHTELKRRRNVEVMLSGVTLHDPATTSIDPRVTISQDVTIYPGVHITGNSWINSGVVLKTGCIINNSTIDENSTVTAYSCISK